MRRMMGPVVSCAILGAAFALSGCTPRTAGEARAQNYLSLGKSALQRGDLASAASFDRLARQADPQNTAALLAEAEVAERQGQFEQAKILLDAYLQRVPKSAEAQIDLGIAELGSGNAEQADAILAPFAKTSTDPRVLRNEAVALDLLGRTADAEAMDRQAIALDPADPVLRGNLALTLAADGQTDAAERMIASAISLPNAPRAEDANAVMLLAYSGKIAHARKLGRQTLGNSTTEALIKRAEAARRTKDPARRAEAFGMTVDAGAPASAPGPATALAQ